MRNPIKILFFMMFVLLIVLGFTRFERFDLPSGGGKILKRVLLADRWTGEQFIVVYGIDGKSEHSVHTEELQPTEGGLVLPPLPASADEFISGNTGSFKERAEELRTLEDISYLKRYLATLYWVSLLAAFGILAWKVPWTIGPKAPTSDGAPAVLPQKYSL